MKTVYNKKCTNCGNLNSLDLNDLKGMPLKNLTGEIVGRPQVSLDKPIHVSCTKCGYPIVFNDD